MEEVRQRIYNVAGPTLARFHASEAFIRIIRGPVRSGSSVACANEIFRQGRNQNLYNGKRRSRFAVVRNTYRELLDTTIKTWKDWFPEDVYGPINKNEMTHYIRVNELDIEVLFRALDTPDDIKKLLSLELTGAWLNEMREIPKPILDTLTERVGQFPAAMDGGCAYPFIIGDTNSPSTDNYLYKLAEKIRPKGWEFFHQPGALLEVEGEYIPNPEAENVQNLNEGINYYLKRVPGKSKDHIRVYYCNQYGFVQEGRAVHESYVDATHCTRDILKPTPGIPITVGIDFGLTPAAVFGQKQANGQWYIIDELVSERMGIKAFCDVLVPHINKEYRGFELEFYGDPAGSQEAQTDQQTPFDILLANGIPAEPAYHNNDPIMRREALDRPLGRMIDGKPGFLLSPKCEVLRIALMGGYCFKRIKMAGEARFRDKPEKNKYSHVAEAAEYLCLGAGEGAMLVKVEHQPDLMEVDYMETRPGNPQGWML